MCTKSISKCFDNLVGIIRPFVATTAETFLSPLHGSSWWWLPRNNCLYHNNFCRKNTPQDWLAALRILPHQNAKFRQPVKPAKGEAVAGTTSRREDAFCRSGARVVSHDFPLTSLRGFLQILHYGLRLCLLMYAQLYTYVTVEFPSSTIMGWNFSIAYPTHAGCSWGHRMASSGQEGGWWTRLQARWGHQPWPRMVIKDQNIWKESYS